MAICHPDVTGVTIIDIIDHLKVINANAIKFLGFFTSQITCNSVPLLTRYYESYLAVLPEIVNCVRLGLTGQNIGSNPEGQEPLVSKTRDRLVSILDELQSVSPPAVVKPAKRVF